MSCDEVKSKEAGFGTKGYQKLNKSFSSYQGFSKASPFDHKKESAHILLVTLVKFTAIKYN